MNIHTVGDLIAALESFGDPAMPVLVEIGEGAAEVVSDLQLINVGDEPTASSARIGSKGSEPSSWTYQRASTDRLPTTSTSGSPAICDAVRNMLLRVPGPSCLAQSGSAARTATCSSSCEPSVAGPSGL